MLREGNGFFSVDVWCVCCLFLLFFGVLVSDVYGCGENVGEGKENGFCFLCLFI